MMTKLPASPNRTPNGAGADRCRVIRDAVLTLTPHEGPGITLDELATRVEHHLASTPFVGTARWYTRAVQLDLAANGALRRVPGSDPARFTLAA